MFRKLSETFTGTHLTAIIIAALICAPGALYATIVAQAVSIADPSSGASAAVDSGRKLSVYDSVAGYANDPKNFVNISDISPYNTANKVIYTIPAGKALIIKSITWSYFLNTEGFNAYIYITDANFATLLNFEGTHAADTESASFDTGIIAPEGPIRLQFYGSGSSGATARTYIQGHLVPAAAVPALNSGQIAHIGPKLAPGARPQ